MATPRDAPVADWGAHPDWPPDATVSLRPKGGSIRSNRAAGTVVGGVSTFSEPGAAGENRRPLDGPQERRPPWTFSRATHQSCAARIASSARASSSVLRRTQTRITVHFRSQCHGRASSGAQSLDVTLRRYRDQWSPNPRFCSSSAKETGDYSRTFPDSRRQKSPATDEYPV